MAYADTVVIVDSLLEGGVPIVIVGEGDIAYHEIIGEAVDAAIERGNHHLAVEIIDADTFHGVDNDITMQVTAPFVAYEHIIIVAQKVTFSLIEERGIYIAHRMDVILLLMGIDKAPKFKGIAQLAILGNFLELLCGALRRHGNREAGEEKGAKQNFKQRTNRLHNHVV